MAAVAIMLITGVGASEVRPFRYLVNFVLHTGNKYLCATRDPGVGEENSQCGHPEETIKGPKLAEMQKHTLTLMAVCVHIIVDAHCTEALISLRGTFARGSSSQHGILVCLLLKSKQKQETINKCCQKWS